MTDGHLDEVGRVSDEIGVLREELGSLVSELDRRRREALDLPLQIRRHPLAAALAIGTAVLLLGGLTTLAVRERRQRRRPSNRAREARRAIARLLADPRRVAPQQSPLVKMATAAGVAAGTAVARRLAQQLMARAASARPR